ncbi:uncharacterized protein LOC133713573 isoform X2 [Rosa rugosa]|nr:uncharacterized protein LOC133713573 isoform X2 [Rosa rugosa]
MDPLQSLCGRKKQDVCLTYENESALKREVLIGKKDEIYGGSVINDEVLYHRGGRDIMRKVIVITSCLPRDMDFIMQKTLTAAAYKCVSVEFLLFEQKSAHFSIVLVQAWIQSSNYSIDYYAGSSM